MERKTAQIEFEQLFPLAFQIDRGGVQVELKVDRELETETFIESGDRKIRIYGQDENKLLCGIYTFFEKAGVQFLLTGEWFCPKERLQEIPSLSMAENASVKNRGIRMHLNFVQDQSFFSEKDFRQFIKRMARMKLNFLLFHMYNSQEWFPFSYRGEEHLELELGNLGREPLPEDMIGREKIKTEKIWYPKELEEITDTRELREAVHQRYCRMMQEAKSYGIRLAASFEPEVISDAFEEKLSLWSKEEKREKRYSLTADWQEGWSRKKLADVSIRNPILIDMAVERALALYKAYPILDELHFISREGTCFQADSREEYEEELYRLEKSLGLYFPQSYVDELWTVNSDTERINSKAYPYWTVLPGQAYIGSVIGALRYLEFVRAILEDGRLQELQRQTSLSFVISLYSPNPRTMELFLRYTGKAVPKGVRFDLLGDYGARDISNQMESWRPFIEGGNETGMISWLEFDGNMALAQGWTRSIYDNVKKAVDIGIQTVYFNHWRLHSLEQNGEIAAKTCYNAKMDYETYLKGYAEKLYGQEKAAFGMRAYEVLEEVTDWCKRRHYNIGFTGDWVYRYSTDSPGYRVEDLEKSIRLYEKAEEYFQMAAGREETFGEKHGAYMAQLCRISAYHLEAVKHLQNSKLPLMGYQCFPAEQEGNWPGMEILCRCVHEAYLALAFAHAYMERYAPWVTDSDEQGQLAHYQIGMEKPLRRHFEALRARYEDSVRKAIER